MFKLLNSMSEILTLVERNLKQMTSNIATGDRICDPSTFTNKNAFFAYFAFLWAQFSLTELENEEKLQIQRYSLLLLLEFRKVKKRWPFMPFFFKEHYCDISIILSVYAFGFNLFCGLIFLDWNVTQSSK